MSKIIDFFPYIQSITATEKTGFMLFGNNNREAEYIETKLNKLGVPFIRDIDCNDDHYVVPLTDVDEQTIGKIGTDCCWDPGQKFTQYLLTFDDEDAAHKFYKLLMSYKYKTTIGYNIFLAPNNTQLIIKCIPYSQRNTNIQNIKDAFTEFERGSRPAPDKYPRKLLFSDAIEDIAYHKSRKHTFEIDTIKENQDAIIREILYRYFNKNLRAFLAAQQSKVDGLNKKKSTNPGRAFLYSVAEKYINNKTDKNINLVRDFLYSVAENYVDEKLRDKKHQKQTIYFDYLAAAGKYNDFQNVLDMAAKWRRKNRRDTRREKHEIRLSQRGTYKLMDLIGDYYIVHLGSQAAFDYESRALKHHKQIHYDDDIYNGFAWYSIRKGHKPILTLEQTRGNEIRCYGYDGPYDKELRDAIRKFMRARDLTIPNNTCDKLLGYIKSHGVVYDIFNLPDNLVLNDSLELNNMALGQIPNMSTVTINGDFSVRKNKLPTLVGAPYRVGGNFDACGNKLTSLLKIPRVGGQIYLYNNPGLIADSRVPDYIEDKLKNGDVWGVSDEIKAAWLHQIADRKRKRDMARSFENNK